jgi:ribonuclease HI
VAAEGFFEPPYKMSLTPTERLLSYSRLDTVSSAQRTLALVAARWIGVEPAAVSDPLLTDLWSSVCVAEATSRNTRTIFDSTPFDLMMAKAPAPAPTRPTKPKSIADYFTMSTPPVDTTPNFTTDTVPTSRAPLLIYCDGACSANGRRGAKAGYGVSVWTTTSPRKEIATQSVRLDPTEPQTNQRAELQGLADALRRATEHPDGADIYTDSQYAINCLQTWGAGWAAKGWRKADGAPVLHQDILRPMWEMWKRRGPHIQLHHVAAHTGRADMHSRGNARADELATKSLSAE